MFKIKSFQRRILLALLGIGLIPAVLFLVLGTFAARWTLSTAGSAGPWSSLAASGQGLLDALHQAEVSDTGVLEAARAHQDALSQSLRQSQIFELVADRILMLLPWVALALAVLIAALAYWAARQLSRGFSRPIKDLVGWTELIGKSEPLPSPGPADTRGVMEFTQLRTALRTMADDLEAGRREAVQAAKLRSWTDMARKVAHELKNPLAPMRMAATTVSRMEGAAAQGAADVLLQEIHRLDEIARNFSQFGRMPEGPPSEVDVDELLRLLIQQHRDVGPTLDYSPDPTLPHITAHYDALLRSFRNLLLNAVDAAGRDGTVRIRAQQDDEVVRVEIQDSGPGIPQDDLDRIWEPEFTTKHRGTGLGLPMVRQTIAFHRGRVAGGNHPDGGAVFVVELPIMGSPLPPKGTHP